MSFFDTARAAVGDAVDKHGDKIAAGLDRAATLADQKTGGKQRDDRPGRHQGQGRPRPPQRQERRHPMTAPIPEERDEAPLGTGTPPGEHPTELPDPADAVGDPRSQEENAETSLDEPSDDSGAGGR